MKVLIWLLILILGAYLGAVAAWFIPLPDSRQTVINQPPASQSQPQPGPVVEPKPAPKWGDLEVSDYQATFSQLLEDLESDGSLVVYDPALSQTLVSIRPDELYFSGSLYKLYIAVLVYRELEQPEPQWQATDPFWEDYTVAGCLNVMVSKSDDCAEIFLTPDNRRAWQAELRTLGLDGLYINSFLASAQGFSELLTRLQAGELINDHSLQRLYGSLRAASTIFNKTFSQKQVYSKNGIYDGIHHNVGIIYFDDPINDQLRPIVVASLGVTKAAQQQIAITLENKLLADLAADPVP